MLVAMYYAHIYRIADIFHGGLIFAFFVMERIRENYARKSLPCITCACAGAHQKSSVIHLQLHEIYHCEKYWLCGRVTYPVLVSEG